MGKFVVKKSLADIGNDLNSITGGTRAKFIETVLERAIFNVDRRGIVHKVILAAWGNGDSNV